jgi:O-6-methylguanine DNA methyltransferase
MKLAIATADGEFTAHYSERGLTQLDFPGDERKCDRKETNGAVSSADVRQWHTVTTKALNEILAGRTPRTLPPLDLSIGTEFQQRVWGALCEISPGKTKSYGEVAAAIKKPGATRAVGGACGANPIPVLIPCHRVLAAKSKLGGFSSGLEWKRKLLVREGIQFD